MSTPPPSGSIAESLFAAWLVRRESGEETDLETLCQAQPQAAPQLRELHEQWARMQSIRVQCGLEGSLFARLATHYGAELDPRVTLESQGQGSSGFSSHVLSRLADRGAASTRYSIQGEVAHGGMGAVLQVWDEDLRRHLAMKVMLGSDSALERGGRPQVTPRQLARFLEEAQVTGQLEHPGIVPVHELGVDAEGRVFFTMKLVRGKTLRTVFAELARGDAGWTQARVLGLILKVCEAVSYAHAKGVIHRDLKPDNVMVGGYGELYVMDWGLAKVLDREDAKDLRLNQEPALAAAAVQSERHDQAGESPNSPLVTMEGDVVGTPAFMSPEQAMGDVAAMGAPSDVYAVGAMLYQLLAGHMPYVRPGESAANFAIWMRVRAGPPLPLEQVAPNAPAELVAICERAMARDRSQRYADMAALAADLSAFLEGRVVHAYETGAWAEARKWVRRNRPLAIALAGAAILALAGLAGIGYVQTKGRTAERIQRERADAKADEAERNERLARAETAKVLRLSDVKVLQELEARADELWPPYPEEIRAMDLWLADARALVGNLEAHRATLREMRASALPWADEDRASDLANPRFTAELTEKQKELADWMAELDRATDDESRASAEAKVVELERRVQELTDKLQSRKTWRFDAAELQWQHDVLAELIEGLERFEADLLAEDASGPDRGWSVPRRRKFAQDLRAGFAEGGTYAAAWDSALPALAETYPGLELETQMGLMPIGPDPASGLWEFAHLMTGRPAERGADGHLVLTEETGVVLVLLRGGSFLMGAQNADPTARNYDAQARTSEIPVHEVELSPFLLSKYELTQGQWLRLTGLNPSVYKLGRMASGLLHPVEQVSWLDCMRWLQRADLSLPSEAQWEYGARGGTETAWWTGAQRESLREAHAANLADQAAARTGVAWPAIEEWPELDDGWGAHAPVGTFEPNDFGLQEVVGNLWEWCLDGYDEGFYRRSSGVDPVAPDDGSGAHVNRGGGFNYSAEYGRSAARLTATESFADVSLGVRPARRLNRR